MADQGQREACTERLSTHYEEIIEPHFFHDFKRRLILKSLSTNNTFLWPCNMLI